MRPNEGVVKINIAQCTRLHYPVTQKEHCMRHDDHRGRV